jgi:hypothetical protein
LLRKSVLGSILSTLTRDSLVNFGQILLMPFFLINFGPTDYSTWLVVLSYTSFIVLSDFGMSTVIIGRMVIFLEENRLFDLTLWEWFKRKTIALAIFMTLVVGALFYSKYTDSLTFGFLVSKNSQLFASLSLASFVTISQHFWLYRMQVLGQNSPAQRTLTLVRLCEVIVLALLLQINLSISTFAWLFLLCKLILFAGFKVSLKKYSNQTVTRVIPANNSNILSPVMSNALVTTANVISIHGSFIVASAWLSPRDLISLAIARMLTSPIRILGTAITSGALPYFIRAYHMKNLGVDNLQILNLVVRKSLFVVAAIAVFVSFLGELAWNVIGQKEIDFNQMLVLLFCISTLSDSILNLKFQRPLVTNKAFFPSAVYFTATVMFAGFQIFLGNFVGIIAVPMCIIIADWITLVFLNLSKDKYGN